MNKNSIKETENRIKKYFFKENKINVIKNIINDLENQMQGIEESIKDLSFISTEKIDIKSPNFEESISSNNTPSSYIENSILSQLEEKEKLMKNIKQEIERYKSEIEVIALESSQMKNIFNILSEESKEILSLRYCENKSEIEISEKLRISIQHYHRKRKEILKDIHNLMIMYKEI